MLHIEKKKPDPAVHSVHTSEALSPGQCGFFSTVRFVRTVIDWGAEVTGL